MRYQVSGRLALPVGHHFLLFLLFLGLKLGGAIEWHWFWVCLPLVLKIALLGALFVRRIMQEADDEETEND